MLQILLICLVVLWLLGYISIPGIVIPRLHFFSFNSHMVGLWDILILLIILWILGLLPSPFRHVAAIIMILWLLSVFGIVVISGLANILILLIIIWIIFSFFRVY